MAYFSAYLGIFKYFYKKKNGENNCHTTKLQFVLKKNIECLKSGLIDRYIMLNERIYSHKEMNLEKEEWEKSIKNLNSNINYEEFRMARNSLRTNKSSINSIELIEFLSNYAENTEYSKILKKIIEQNKLTDFDDAKILPNSQKEKSLI